MIFVALFEWSLGPVPYLYIAEILPEKAFGFAIFLNLLFTLIIGLVSPLMFTYLGGATFYVFAAGGFIVNL